MLKAPTPKYATTQMPEVPVCRVNALNNMSIGRQYKLSRRGTESCYIFVEFRGERRYMTEARWSQAVLELWDSLK
jgi:hypothetical protein